MSLEVKQWLNNNELSYTIWNNKYRNNNETFSEWLNRVSNNDNYIKQLIINKKFLFGGRTLSNRGLNNGSYSNCYSRGFIEDDLNDILNANKDIALTFKAQGGQGLSLSKIRPKGSLIGDRYNSDGIIPFMKLFNQTTRTISQCGHRKGALLMSLDVLHKDIEDFITIKSNENEINSANLSVEIDSTFMNTLQEAYKNNSNPIINIKKEYGGKEISYDVDVRKIYEKICYNALKHAEPGIIYTDKFRNYNLMEFVDNYNIETCNPCQPEWATVLTPNGISTIGEINIGDKIWSSEGWTTIINKQCTGIKNVHEYRTAAGNFIGTDNHRIVSNGEKIEVKDAKSIDTLEGDNSINDKLFIMPDEIKAGMVIGSGIIINNHIYISFKNYNYDSKHQVIEFVGDKYREDICDNIFDINTDIKCNEIFEYSLKEIPERYFKGSSIKVSNFLKGLFSVLGSLEEGKIILKIYSPKLRDQIQMMLSSLGIRSYYNVKKSKEYRFIVGSYIIPEIYTINITTDKYLFYDKIGFIQDDLMEKLKSILKPIKHKSKSYSITSDTIISNEQVYSITASNTSHTYWTGGLNVSNCGEQPLPKNGACNLCSINLSEYIINPYEDNCSFNLSELQEDMFHIVKAMDDIVSENSYRHALKSQQEMSNNYRNIGIGFMGLADALIKMKMTYGSEHSIKFVSNICKEIFRSAVLSSAKLAKERGNFNGYDAKVWDSNIIKNAFNEEEIKTLKSMNLLRNCSLISIAPTGSIGTMLNISTGIEPFYQLSYVRKTESLNNKDTYYNVDVAIVKDFKEQTNTDVLPDFFISSENINYNDRIEMQSAIQKYVDTAISSTINLPSTTTQKEIEDIFMKSYIKGLKGVTVYVDGSRSAVLTKTIPINDSFKKRPKELDAMFYTVKVKKEQFIVLVGLFDNKPYEIFTFKPDTEVDIPSHKGKIIKHKKMKYSFNSIYINIEDISNISNNMEEKAATLYASLSLRHNIDIKYIIKTAKKVNDNINSFTIAMCRILSKYIKDEIIKEPCPECGGELIRKGGCIECLNCGYSRCE